MSVSALHLFLARFAADEGFVYFDAAAARTERSRQAARTHSLAQAMRNEPCGFVRHAKHAFDLLAADALLVSSHQRGGEQPLVETDLAALEQRADRNRELIAAVSAVVQAGTMRRALKLRDAIPRAA